MSEKIPFDPSIIPRDRPGSPYLEIVLDGAKTEVYTALGKAVADQAHFMTHTAPFRAPELGKDETYYRVELLKKLVTDGKVNLWDLSIDMADETGKLDDGFGIACDKVIALLDLEVKTQE